MARGALKRPRAIMTSWPIKRTGYVNATFQILLLQYFIYKPDIVAMQHRKNVHVRKILFDRNGRLGFDQFWAEYADKIIFGQVLFIMPPGNFRK